MMNKFTSDCYSQNSSLKVNKVLRNCYFLLSLNLLCSTFFASISFFFNMPVPNLILSTLIFYTLLISVYLFSDNINGITAIFLLSAFVGYTLGPTLNFLISYNAFEIVIFSFFSMTMIFFFCYLYLKINKKDVSLLSNFLISGILVLTFYMFVYSITNINKLVLTINSLIILLSSIAILIQINNIIIGGEKNYIRATISLYLSLYNIFLSLLGISINFRRF